MLHIRVARLLLALEVHRIVVERVRLLEQVLHHVKLEISRLEVDIFDQLLELCHGHLDGVLGRDAAYRLAIVGKDLLDLAEHGLQRVVHLLLPEREVVQVGDLDVLPAVAPLPMERKRLARQRA